MVTEKIDIKFFSSPPIKITFSMSKTQGFRRKKCTCTSIYEYNNTNCRSTYGHECICDYATFLCKSTTEHKCTCYTSPDHCSSKGNNHICRCKEDSPNSCKALTHICSCSTYPSSCHVHLR